MNMNCLLTIFRGSLLLLTSLFLLQANAQKQPTKLFDREVSFINENDAYLFNKKDAYYTNGLFLGFSKADEKKGVKRIRSFEIGQKIFTPLSRDIKDPSQIDRPFCGLITAEFRQTRFLKKESLIQSHIAVDVTGNASFGESIQNSYHRLFHYARFNGWQYQVPDAFGFDIGISYARTLLEDSNWIKWIPKADINIGTGFTNASIGFYLCVGAFEKNRSSALWNASVQSNKEDRKRKHEFFAYWNPQIIWQGYNMTIQGGWKNSDTTAFLSEPERWMFQQSIGICYATHRWTTKAAWVYQSIESVHQLRAQQYGSLSLSYRLH